MQAAAAAAMSFAHLDMRTPLVDSGFHGARDCNTLAAAAMHGCCTRSSAAARPVKTRDEARALPHLAPFAVELFLRGLDRCLVVVGFDPFAGRDPSHAIEAVKPV